MDYSKFKQLLLRPESSTLDFKQQQYDFENDQDGKKTAEFVKDVACFCNTIRTESAFIIIGIDEKKDGTKEHIGLKNHIDDSVFQEKVKNKLIPIPEFSYRTIEYEGLIFGIFEFPVRKYSTPITATQKLKGLEPGKFYFRRNSSNSEANGFETINIARWLESLPDISTTTNLVDEVSRMIKKLTEKNTLLSECISDCLGIASKFVLNDLKVFCVNELSGYEGRHSSEEIQTRFSYRTSSIIFTPRELNIPHFIGWDARRMIYELKKLEDVFETRMFLPFSISKIEEYREKLSASKNILLTLQMGAGNFIDIPKAENVVMTVIMHQENFDAIYLNIKQKLIDKIVSLH